MNEDKFKQVVDMAIACGRKRLSQQTGYIHHCYHAVEDETHYPIPLIENALFGLALLRSKTMDNMNEGKAILERLIPFQISDGNFPIYLHDYPVAKDRFLGVHLLPIFYWILKQFGSILGSELKQKLERSNQLLLDYCLKTQKEINPPPHIAIKIAAVAKAYGRPEGDELLKIVKKPDAWWSPVYLGEYLSALQIVYPSLKNSPWNDFWGHLEQTWHRPSGAFVGPAHKESQYGYEPQSTLYDLYMGALSEQFSSRALLDQPAHLYGALIQPTEDRIRGNEHKYAFSYVSFDEPPLPNVAKLYHPLKIVWGNLKRCHSFVMQGGNFAQLQSSHQDNVLEFLMDLGPMVNIEDRESSREVSFYFDVADGTHISVDGEASNTFKLGQVIRIAYGGVDLKIQFDLIEGEGHFFGHLMRGNRLSQIATKGNHRFKAYDWTLFLRTLRRTEKCKLRVRVAIE